MKLQPENVQNVEKLGVYKAFGGTPRGEAVTLKQSSDIVYL